MTTRAGIKSQLLSALGHVLDEPLCGFGFVRGQQSFTYSRILHEAEQHINLVVEYFPKSLPDAETRLHPMFQLRMKRVSETALSLVKGDRLLLAGAPEILLNQPIEFMAPKERHERWFVTGKEEAVTACSAIKLFLLQWVVPFISEISLPSDLVKLYERNDERIIKQKHWHVFVAAAYLILGQVENARRVAERHFARPGLQKRYASLLSSLGGYSRVTSAPDASGQR